MTDKAACLLCFEAKKHTIGTVAMSAGSTTGLKRHYMNNHKDNYNKMLKTEGTPDDARRKGPNG
jgi:hypothetical protein